MSFTLLGILNSQAAGAGGAGAYDLLETTVLTSSVNTVTFTGLDTYTDYKHLQVRVVSRNWRTGVTDSGLKINGSNVAHNSHSLFGNGTSVDSVYDAESSLMVFKGFNPDNGETANVFSSAVIDILDFSSSTKKTTVRALSGYVGSATEIALNSGLWDVDSAVTSLEFDALSGGFITGSRFSLYGIR